jgi:hypothetical protein
MDTGVEQPPHSGKISCRVAGGHVTPIQHCAEMPLADQHIPGVEVTMIQTRSVPVAASSPALKTSTASRISASSPLVSDP